VAAAPELIWGRAGSGPTVEVKGGEMLPYVTPEWVAQAGTNYTANPENAEKTFRGMNIFLTFRVLADPKFGLHNDICFAMHLQNGVLQPDSSLVSKADAFAKSDFVVCATPDVWKAVIKKQKGFISAFMTGKIKLDKGNPTRMVSLASKSSAVVEAFYRVDTEWPDEMSPQRLAEYEARVSEFRQRLGI
jgi:putative sterol carrier protein